MAKPKIAVFEIDDKDIFILCSFLRRQTLEVAPTMVVKD